MTHQSIEFVPHDIWDREYTSVKAIPSSTREEPAKALVLFVDLMGLSEGTRILDAGCGNGRNAVFLARRGCSVTAVDFSSEALKETKRRAKFAGVESKISVLGGFIGDPLPLSEGSFDVGLDCYTFCHFLTVEAGKRFWKELSRIVKQKGQLFSIVFSLEDEYYAQFPLTTTSEGIRVVIDPSNGVSKRIFSESEIKNYLSALFFYRFFTKFEFMDTVHGEQYKRVVYVSVLQIP